MASAKREPSKADEPAAKKVKVAVAADSSEPKAKHQRVLLNPADCNLDFNIEDGGLRGFGLYEQGFAYCWSGARANVGITGGKYCFSCKIISGQPVDMKDTPPDQQHVCRLGISRGDDDVGSLGETSYSFGFGGTGKFSNAGKFLDYGEKFGVGDTVVCALDLETKPLAAVSFSKNGKWLGPAKLFDAGPKGLGVVDSPVRKLQWDSALFPHVLLKNVVVQLQFSTDEGLVPEEGYKPWASALVDGNAVMGPTFSNPSNCEVLMMVGLPASGKTTWAEKWVKEHPEKHYVVLGTNLALDQMKVPGLLRKHNYGGRFERLMDQATGIFNTLLSRAAGIYRNYIIDQTNVYKNARKRKMKPFAKFRKIAVVVFPKPEDLKFRAGKRFKEMGKEVPADAINEMIANYVLPVSKDMANSDEYFDQVMFPELSRGEAQKYLNEMKLSLRPDSNMNSKEDFSSHSRESSVHSYSSHSLHNCGSLSVAGGHPQSSQSLPPPNYDYWRPNQLTSAYEGAGLHGNLSSLPRDASYRTGMNYSSSLPGDNSYGSSLPRDNSIGFRSHGGYSVPGRPDIRSSGSGIDTFRSSGVGDPYSRMNVEDRTYMPEVAYSPYGGSVTEPYRRYNFERSSSHEPPLESVRSSFTYNSFGGHIGHTVAPQADLVPRNATFLPGPSPAVYGSPYGTPTGRTSYANFPGNMPHSGGYPSPRRRNY
ncbi:uncharacterized protein LOC131153342 isoform X2 [Malania oleifera]|uniref:uncharacterized protein LOC131153342 isoform X2 n=1 Tax=Malania oleifera TaxID=397392 RepID=UPI0025ADEB29|nr:uncharacterized protein LOC131153342 isoform X2 [Malania oleifera]